VASSRCHTLTRAGIQPVVKSTFHAGERAVQRAAGVEAEAARLSGMVRATLAPPLRKALGSLRMAVAATRDAEGRVWASLLTGPPGFIGTVDDTLVLVSGSRAPHDGLPERLAARPEVGLLAIDLETRVRIRLNGAALHDPDRGLFLSVREAYANCPQYIHPRPLGFDPALLRDAQRAPSLDAEARDRVARADTFFIASAHPSAGADASHRGGEPGFVRVLDERTLQFPDFPGNNMFNTLGNLAVEPRAGLLFVDFAGHALLQLTGAARLAWAEGRATVTFEIGEALSHRAPQGHLMG
jgi:predicted pyridoxine 5'-phosphate oxidase superfamily flavin-nucleotide-binding protein